MWLDLPSPRLTLLPQQYRRLSDGEFAYQSPSYEAVLAVAPRGFVTRYPGLWEAEVVLDTERPLR